MSEKSYVSSEQHACLVCGRPFDTGALLLDRTLRLSMERHTITGWDLCPEHRKLHQQGFIALVECDPTQSGHPTAGARLAPSDAYRTGKVAHLKREVFVKMFDAGGEADLPCVFVDPEVMEMLERLRPASE